jgi:Domain of unknown function (DUF4082)
MEYRPRRALKVRSGSRKPVVGVTFACVMALVAAVLWVGAPLSASASPGAGIWSDDVRPLTTADPETSSVELGTVFVSAVDGWVTAIRYYKSLANRGPHVGKLWAPDGTVLTTVAFSTESLSGWQTAELASPIRISSGKSYTVSYRAPHGRYADDEWVFSNGRTIKRGPLTAVRGVYAYGSGRPTLVWHDSNYYVDVRFVDIKSPPTAGTSSTAPTTAATSTQPPTPTATAQPTSVATSFSPSTTSSVSSSPSTTSSVSSSPSTTSSVSSSPSTTSSVSSSPSTTSSVSSSPSPTAGAWPNETNTGVAGCPPLTRRDSDLRVKTSGTTVENVELHGQLTFEDGVKNVTVRCVKVISGTWFPVDTERSGYTSANDLLFERVEVTCNGSDISSAGMLLFGATVRKGRVYDCTDAYRWSSEVVIEDSLCHKLQAGGNDPHYDCAQTGGAQDVIIRHNTFIGRDTSDVAVWPDLGPVDNVLIENNLLIGSPGYILYVGKNSKTDPVTNIVVRNNRFGPGYWGPCTIENANPVWEGNVWHASGLPLPRSSC